MEQQIILHKRSEESGRTPTPNDIEHGEIAINYASDTESLFFKNSSNEIVTIKDKKYIDNTIQNLMTDVQQLIDDAIADLDISGGGSSGGGNTEVSTKGGTILFEVLTTNANFSDVTLSQSTSNFTQLDICCCTDVGEAIFTSVYNPNGSVFNVSSTIQESGELIIKSKQYEINGSNITAVQGLGGMLSVSSDGIETVDGNYIGIYKVIGY